MKSLIRKQAEQLVREQKRNRHLLTLFFCLAVIVFFGTVAALKYNGTAMNHTGAVLNCKYAAHVHTDTCYTQTETGRILSCGYADYVVHTHNDDCRDADGHFVCPLPEVQRHQHSASCYQKEQVLVCGIEESSGHLHDENCYSRERGALSCQQEEHMQSERCYDEKNNLICEIQEHQHDDVCYEWEQVLVCGMKEGEGGHLHDANCYSQEQKIICGKAELHTHVLQNEPGSCYDAQGNLVCGLLQLEEHIHGDECIEAVELTKDEVAALNDSETETERSDHRNTEMSAETEAETETEETEYVSEESRVQTVETESYIITVDYTKASNLPDQVEVRVTEFAKGSEEYEIYRKEADAEFDWLLDISFFADGVKTEPNGNVDVKVTAKTDVETISPDIVHFTEQGVENLDGIGSVSDEGQMSVEFSSDSFSVYGSRSAEKPVYNGKDEPTSIGNPHTLAGDEFQKIELNKMLSNGKWEKVDMDTYIYTVGDKIKLNIDYGLPEGTLKDTNTVIYHLPAGIVIKEAEDAPIYDNNNQIIGRIYVDTDGKVTMIYSDQFRKENTGIEHVKIGIEAVVSSGNASDDGNIVFPGNGGGTIHIQNKSDLDLRKTGTYDTETKKIKYVLTASTQNGSGGKVNIHDTFANNANTPDAKITSFTVKKVDADGNSQIVPMPGTEDSYQITGGEGSNTFDITGLPALGAGEKYVVEYTVDPGEIIPDKDGTTAKLVNDARADDGKINRETEVTTDLSKPTAEKWDTSYVQNGDEIVWTVTVKNPTGMDLGGKTIEEILPEGLSYVEDSLTVNWNKPGGDWPANFEKDENGKLIYTFPPQGTGCTGTEYTIQFRTKVDNPGNPGDHQMFQNKIVFDGKPDTGKGDYTYPKEEESTGNIWKAAGGDPVSQGDAGIKKMTWNLIVQAPGGGVTSVIVKDSIKDAVNKDTHQDYTNSHYMTKADIDCLVEAIKRKGYQAVCKTYSDTDWMTEAGEEEQIKSFELEIKKLSADGKELPFDKDEKIEFSYQTSMDMSVIPGNGNIQFLNTACMGEHQTSADYTKKSKVDKRVQGGTGKYGDNLSVDYDKGILHYVVILRLDSSDFENSAEGGTGEIKLTDKMSEGMEIVPSSVKAFYWSLNNDSNEWFNDIFKGTESVAEGPDGQFVYRYPSWDGQVYRPTDHITTESNGNITKITISDYPVNKTDKPLIITYDVDLTGSDEWKADGKISKYKNNVISWENHGMDDSGITINKEKKYTEKRGEIDAGNTNQINYSVDINPSGSDLDQLADTLTLKDNFKIYNKDMSAEAADIYAYLQLGDVRLYTYRSYYQFNEDGSRQTDADGNPLKEEERKRVEISRDRYSISYDQKKNEIKLTLPDELACVLEYAYVLEPDPNLAKNTYAVKNNVSLLGKKEEGNHVTWTNTGITSQADSMSVKLIKSDGADRSHRLEGVEFHLYRCENGKWISVPKKEQEDLITPENGTLDLTAYLEKEDDPKHYYRDVLFKLEEVKTADNYQLKNFYFVCCRDKTAATVEKPAGETIRTEDIVELKEYGGTIYALNDYTAIKAKKIWADADGNEIEAPEDQTVTLELRKGTVKGYKVTMTIGSSYGEAGKYLVEPGTSFSVVNHIGYNANAEIFYADGSKETIAPDESQETGAFGEVFSYTFVVRGDCTIQLPWGSSVDDLQYTQPTGKTDEVTVDKQELNADNSWSYTWTGLDALKEGEVYYVEEIDVPEGWIVSYMNNSGIHSGMITVTNRSKKRYTIPETGGAGTIRYTFGGALLIIAAGLMYGFSTKRKREGRESF